MAISGTDKIAQQSQAEIQRIADVSMRIRQAVRASLPAPPEQFFTMMVPGKVLNFDDFLDGFDDKGRLTGPIKPNSVRLAEAVLCDDMPALSAVQLGPTGKSVARSYSATLDKLIPTTSTTGFDEGIDAGELTDEKKRYKQAMTYLTSPDPLKPSNTRIDTYRDKQKLYTQAVEDRTTAFNNALDAAQKNTLNTTPALQRAQYDKWVAENYKTYNNHVQAAYMDWVTVGKKEEVEYWFAIIDNDTAIARVEASKAAMRIATIADSDGASEYQTVQLTPSNWAFLAQQKSLGGPTGDTVESLTWEISRLQKINLLLSAFIKSPPAAPSTEPPDPTTPPSTAALQPYTELIAANREYQAALSDYEKTLASGTDDATKKQAVAEKLKALNDKRDALAKSYAEQDKANIAGLSITAQKALADLFSSGAEKVHAQITANDTEITNLKTRLSNLVPTATATSFQDSAATDAGIAPPLPPPPPPNATPNFWTSITLEVSDSYSAKQSDSSSTSYSVGGGASWGLWSVGGSYSHSDTSASAAAQMANSSVKVSFECLRVDMTRSWLRPELFFDSDLEVPPGTFVSPGAIKLASLMDPVEYTPPSAYSNLKGLNPAQREAAIQPYSLFPMYPTAFFLAANVVLEVEGQTSDIQSHFATSSTSASASVGYGPFSVTGSYSHTEAHADSTCETTATGCRITIKSPQIIGWVSEIVPALPRL